MPASLPAPLPAEQYVPGLNAPVSGVYRVIHHEHRPVHNVVIIRGDVFPSCRNCHSRVCYVLFVEVDYVTHDLDLCRPNPALME